MNKNHFYEINLGVNGKTSFKTPSKLADEDAIVQYALDNFIIDPEDGDPWDTLDYAQEITKEQYNEFNKE